MRILLVEQDKVVCYVLGKLLAKKTGAQVDTAATMCDAFVSLHKNKYALVIMANSMPDAFGIDALPLIHDRWPSLYIIMFTSYAITPEFCQKALAHGAEKVFWKSVELEGMVKYAQQIVKASLLT